MPYKFYAYSHPNILGTHKATFEFTKDREVSLKGDCIIGVNADFDLSEIKRFIKSLKSNKISITINAALKSKSISAKETIFAEINPDFNSDNEIVIRKTDFISERTLGINADKSALELDRKLVGILRENGNKLMIVIEDQNIQTRL